ncbi:hypothetical protein, partial [Proteus mirabilis]|uniref:hypothetical protein n=1 Tax=Proteus mirabilis TaxID=584 RepID=UPI001073D633
MRPIFLLIPFMFLIGCTEQMSVGIGTSRTHNIGYPVCSTLVCGKIRRTVEEHKEIIEAVHEQQRAI